MQEAPKTLSKEARNLWDSIVKNYEFDVVGLPILQNALESYDRMKAASKILNKEGLVVKDRFKFPRPHPAVKIELEARLCMLRHLRALGLEFSDMPGSEGVK